MQNSAVYNKLINSHYAICMRCHTLRAEKVKYLHKEHMQVQKIYKRRYIVNLSCLSNAIKKIPHIILCPKQF